MVQGSVHIRHEGVVPDVWPFDRIGADEMKARRSDNIARVTFPNPKCQRRHTVLKHAHEVLDV